MNKHLHKAGIIVAISIPLFVLPARISEGQWADPVNLIGSEIVIFFMSLTCWYCIHYIQQRHARWQGLILSLLCCCLLSNLFYFTFNPIFKDFPFRTAQNPLGIKILMLSSRGILMSIILIPAAYYLKRDGEARHQRKENERLAMERVRIENRLLEQAVVERTRALQQALVSLEKSQKDLEHQLYVQSRIVASITHDIRGPFNFLVIISEEICRMLENKDYETVAQYSLELNQSLEKMFGYVKNLLEFTKIPVQQKLAISDKVNLSELVSEKSELFEGVIRTNNNTLHIAIDPAITVMSNSNLLGIVLHNLIDNANKYTRNGEIRVNASAENNVVQIELENSGSSVPELLVQWFNSNGHSNGEREFAATIEVAGIGLILIREIASLLDIGLYMESDQQSTRVRLTLQESLVAEASPEAS
ncbi:sensor histidine kinase [Dyadobacter crusticola]|uniref:sensor histidine kinase n=1 Tax=Dyadobacter crusticola TaxID=292407 RepID=UPI0004E1CC92|nr:HAMP domain-containing sensor histidine kinase [Dyadobacter crusticola]